jgi:hypothetical protein
MKRNINDVVANPLEAFQQKLGLANDQAFVLNELTSKAATGDKQARTELANLIASGYNPAGIFVGPSSRTWNKGLADKFVDLEKQGLSALDLWKQTGTYRSPDGVLKQELPDNLAKLRTTFSASMPSKQNQYVGGIEGPIGGMVEHQELFKAYPDLLQTLRYTVTKQPDWLPESAASAQYSRTIGGKEKISTNTKTEEDALTKLVHELQHAIQQREKWQAGGTESQFQDKPGITAFEQYRSLPGEAEARAAQIRRTMTPEQRREVFPLSSYDIPVESLMFRDPFGNPLR